jgi:hypothetical protein
MFNGTVPVLPVLETSVGQVPPTTTDPEAVNIAAVLQMGRVYYNFLNACVQFMQAVQQFPTQLTQAQLAMFAQKLTKLNTGMWVYVSDYAHFLIWTGTGWTWAPGELGSGYVLAFATAGPSPAVGWHVADGTVGVSFLKSDGTLGTQTVPNTAGSFFRV